MTNDWPPEIVSWTESKEFHDRCCELFDRFDRGELMAAQAAADFIGLPFQLFRECFAGWAALEHFKAGATMN